MTRRRSVLVVASLLMVGAIIGGFFIWRGGSSDDQGSSVPPGATEAAALLAAQKTAIAFFTLDPDHVTAQVDGVLAVATGKFKREYGAQRSAVIASVTTRKRVVSAKVPMGGTAIASYTDSVASVLVEIDVTSHEGTGLPFVNHYRMVLTENRNGAVWDTSTLDQLAGVPGQGTFTPGALPGGNTAVVRAAAKGVSRALAYDYTTLDADLAATLPLLTPTFGADFAKTFNGAVRPLATKKKASTAAYVRAAGLVLRDGTKARCLVFVDQVLDPTGSATVNEARVFVDLQLVKGVWLIANLKQA